MSTKNRDEALMANGKSRLLSFITREYIAFIGIASSVLFDLFDDVCVCAERVGRVPLEGQPRSSSSFVNRVADSEFSEECDPDLVGSLSRDL